MSDVSERSLLRVPSRAVVLALLAIVVVVLTTLGALEELPTWLRAILQAVGTLSGVWLGAHLQLRDERVQIESAPRWIKWVWPGVAS